MIWRGGTSDGPSLLQRSWCRRCDQGSIEFGNVSALFVGIILIVSLLIRAVSRDTKKTPTIICACLFVFHPAWMISAISGDCGWMKTVFSTAFSVLATIAIGWQIVGLFGKGGVNEVEADPNAGQVEEITNKRGCFFWIMTVATVFLCFVATYCGFHELQKMLR